MKLLKIFLLVLYFAALCALTYVGSADAQILKGSRLWLYNNTDSSAVNSTTGIIRYDPATGKFRFYNALTGTWFTYSSGSGGIAISSSQVAYGSGTNTVKGEAVFTYNETTDELSVRRVKALSSSTFSAFAQTGVASDPSTLSNGDIWYNTTTNKLRGRENGASVDLVGSSISGLTANRIPYATSATAIGDDDGLTWDPANNDMRITGGLAVGDALVGDVGGNIRGYFKNGTGNTQLIVESTNQTGVLDLLGTRASANLDAGAIRFYNAGNNISLISASRTANTDAGYLQFFTKATGTGIAERVRITEDGRLYGTALHNNAGAVTGTTNQYIASGTTGAPTVTSIANLDATPTIQNTYWSRTGNVVTWSGQIGVDATASNTVTTFRVTLPIASDFTGGSEDLAGTGAFIESASPGAVYPVHIRADAVNDQAHFHLYPGTTASGVLEFTLQYVVQ